MKGELKPVVDKIKELFLTERHRYIIQLEDGSYSWFDSRKNSHQKRFNDGMIASHVKRKSTYGVFCGEILTKFISFDVDIPDLSTSKKVVHNIYRVLNQLGVPTEFIYTSWSGSKGFHVDIYFSSVIEFKKMKRLYDATVSRVYKDTVELTKPNAIECRPTPSQGIKLPLSINRKNKDPKNNICWYVDIHNDFAPIESIEYILGINQFNTDLIREIINNLPIEEEAFSINKTDLIKEKPAMPNFSNVLAGETLNSLEYLYINGLSKLGTRNQSLCKLAIYLNSLNLSKDECENELIKWMSSQDTKYYKTPLKDCYKEIGRIVSGVYEKNIVLTKGNVNLTVSRSELLTIYQYPKKLHKVLHALLLHSKRFKDSNNQFYMTFEQISSAAHCSIRTAVAHIKKLEGEKIISVFRSPIKYNEGNYKSEPNKYQLTFNWLEDEKEIIIPVKIKMLEEYYPTRINLIMKAFPNKEWMNMDSILYKALLKDTKDNK